MNDIRKRGFERENKQEYIKEIRKRENKSSHEGKKRKEMKIERME